LQLGDPAPLSLRLHQIGECDRLQVAVGFYRCEQNIEQSKSRFIHPLVMDH